MAKAIVCDAEQVTAIEQDLGGDCVVVTFNEMGFVRNGLRFWGDDFLLQEGISAFGIVTPNPNWYPRQAADEVIAAVVAKIGGRRVVTCGLGQGGYGALKFSAQLKASTALAFNPQWSIDPADVASFDSRFVKYYSEPLSNGARIEQQDLCNCAFVVFDKMQKIDATHVAKLAALDGVKPVSAPFFVNDTVRSVTEGKTSAKLVKLCMSSTPLVATDLRQVIRAHRQESRSYLNAVLRHLILRTSQSHTHSSIFVAGLLNKTNNADHPFYSSLISYARGNVDLALSELRQTTAEHLKHRDLLPLLRVTKKLRFLEAEVAVAAQICQAQRANTEPRLCAVDTLIRAGNMVDAHRELTRLTKREDAVRHIGQFVEYALRLRKPEVLEALLSDALPRSAKVSVLFGLVECYRQLGDRKNAFRGLMDLAQTCSSSLEDLRRVAACSAELGEFSLALDIRKRLLRSAPGDNWLALDVVEVKAQIALRKDKHRAHAEWKKVRSELTEIMTAPDLSGAAWERASHLYEDLDDVGAALRAVRKAVEGTESGFDVRRRLVQLLLRTGRRRSARRELESLFIEYRKDANRLRALGALALWLRDRQLAQSFAEAQFECAPTEPESTLYLAWQLRTLGKRGRAQGLLLSLYHAERQSPCLSDKQWARLAEELYEVGDITVVREAIAEAVARDPDSEIVRRLIGKKALTEKLGEALSPTRAREKHPAIVQLGLFSRLGKIFRR